MKLYRYFVLVLTSVLWTPWAAHAQSILSGVPSQCIEQGNCELNDFVSLAISMANWILGIAGVAALLFFVWAGVRMISSAGGEGLQKAKTTFINAALGLIIVMVAYVGVRFVITELLGIELRQDFRIIIQTPRSGACYYTTSPNQVAPQCVQVPEVQCPPPGAQSSTFQSGAQCGEPQAF
jgi:hypothetical protein